MSSTGISPVQLNNVLQKKKELGEKLTDLEAKAEIYRQCKDQYQTLAERYQPILDSHVESKNGTEATVQKARNALHNARQNMENEMQTFCTVLEESKTIFSFLLQDFKNLILLLFELIKQWQKAQQFRYAELYADVDLESFAPLCAETGELLREILSKNIPRLKKAVNSVLNTDAIEILCAEFRELLTTFYHRTFVVVSQEGKHDPWNIKKGSGAACTPKITLRILGADSLKCLGGTKVQACFVKESLINEYYDCNTKTLDTNGLEKKGWKFQDHFKLEEFVHNPISDVCEAVFNVEVKVDLKRSREVKVLEEKYRMVFFTQMGEENYWTLSLPMVVTTGGIQHCQCLASVMWQCFSTDVFALPTEAMPDLPWCQVVEMLQAKLHTISSRRLTQDNIAHLKQRLIGKSEADDNTAVSLQQFCIDALPNSKDDKGVEFSFWKWFLSIYNLIETYLQELWDKGFIEGFLSRKMAERKLAEAKPRKPGIFLLRFSDNTLDSSQAKDAILGKVTPSILLMKSKDNKKHWVPEHFLPIGHSQLTKDNLPTILSKTRDKKGNNIYKYCCTDPLTPCEQMFKGHISAENPETSRGYHIPRVGYTIDTDEIDEELSNLHLLEGQSCSSAIEIDSGTDDEITPDSASEAKKLKGIPGETSSCNIQDKDDVAYEVDMVIEETDTPAKPASRNPLASNTSVLRQLLTEPVPSNETGRESDTVGKSLQNDMSLKNASFSDVVASAKNNTADNTNLLPTVLFDTEHNVVAKSFSHMHASVLNSTEVQSQDGPSSLQILHENQKQIIVNSETPENILESALELSDDYPEERILENVKSYLGNLPPEKLPDVIPEDVTMKLISPFLQKLSNVESLIMFIQQFPNDSKQRLLQALQETKT